MNSALLALVLGLGLSGCYDVPRPACGFRCGPEGACPEDYTCNPQDGRCHLDGSSPELVCGAADATDAAIPDAASDAATDAAASAATDAAASAALTGAATR